MESDLGKLFVRGISWDTDEERLRDYFSKYSDVVEAVIMRDQATDLLSKLCCRGRERSWKNTSSLVAHGIGLMTSLLVVGKQEKL